MYSIQDDHISKSSIFLPSLSEKLQPQKRHFYVQSQLFNEEAPSQKRSQITNEASLDKLNYYPTKNYQTVFKHQPKAKEENPPNFLIRKFQRPQRRHFQEISDTISYSSKNTDFISSCIIIICDSDIKMIDSIRQAIYHKYPSLQINIYTLVGGALGLMDESQERLQQYLMKVREIYKIKEIVLSTSLQTDFAKQIHAREQILDIDQIRKYHQESLILGTSFLEKIVKVDVKITAYIINHKDVAQQMF